MSIVVEIVNTTNLRRAKTLLGTKSDGETLELALERIIEQYEPISPNIEREELSDEFFEDLFAEESILEAGETCQALVADREESRY